MAFLRVYLSKSLFQSDSSNRKWLEVFRTGAGEEFLEKRQKQTRKVSHGLLLKRHLTWKSPGGCGWWLFLSSGSCLETPTGSPIGQGRVGVPYLAAEAWEALQSRRLLAQFTSQKKRPRRDSAGICHILRDTDICCALSVPSTSDVLSPSKCEQGAETTAGARVFDLGNEN